MADRWWIKKTEPLEDARQFIKPVRENASNRGIGTDEVGLIGFSAGGHGFVSSHKTRDWMMTIIKWMKSSGRISNYEKLFM